MLNEQLEALDYSRVIVPANVGIKYRPPKLGIEFYLKNDENFNRSLSSRRHSYASVLINDLDEFNDKLLVHEIHLDRYFFTKEAQIYGEQSYDAERVNAHLSPMKTKLSAFTITRELYNDSANQAFLNAKLIKFQQIERLIQRMIDRYTNFYQQRSASRDRKDDSKDIDNDNKENTSKISNLKSK